jgi:phage terminase large subunit GpA-like protein
MRLPLSNWIEANLALPDDVSARPGSVRLYPYQKGIADAISDPLIERVSVVKSARIGYTTLLVGALGNHVVNDPAPVRGFKRRANLRSKRNPRWYAVRRSEREKQKHNAVAPIPRRQLESCRSEGAA